MSEVVSEVLGALAEAAEGDKGKTVDAPDKKAEETPKFTQADVDRLIKERLDRAEKKAKEAADKAAKDADEQALAKNAEWKTLAEKRQAELEALTPYKAQLEEANAVLTEVLEAFRKEAPEEVLEALADKSPANQLRFINKYREKWVKATPNGVGSNPAGSTGKQLTSEEREKAKSQDHRQMRGFFH